MGSTILEFMSSSFHARMPPYHVLEEFQHHRAARIEPLVRCGVLEARAGTMLQPCHMTKAHFKEGGSDL
jgi:hypothetical protein